MSNYYETLGVSQDASKDEIKSAFRKKARTLHPDVNKEPDAEEKFKELGKAYETLMDDNKRATYDRYGEDGLKNAGFDTGGPFAGGFGDLNDIFNSFFGGMGGFSGFGFGGRPDPNAPVEGDDLRLDIEIDFEQAVFGTDKEIKFDHLETCSACNGTGSEKGSKPETCPTCHGTGQVQQVMRTPLGSIAQIVTCPDCQGKGKKISSPCKACKGAGKIEKEKKVEIKIPAGVDNMSKIRVSGEGDAGTNGGRAGDLFVVLHVKPSEYFKRDGNDVYSRLDITPAQAVLGDEIVIKTLDGEQKIQIAPGVQSGNSVKIKNAGVPYLSRPSQRGDHVVIISVKTPTHLSDEERNLYKKLYELQKNKKPQESILDKVKGVFNNA
ncbi:MAG: molecular chaperone DnaJ [Candidatus Gastranaerophilaceae bacterium]